MLKTIKTADRESMPRTLKLRDAADINIREFINKFRASNEEYVIQDDDDETVAVMMPAGQYEMFRSYQRRREQNFAVIDRIREKMKDVDPDELQARIDQAVEEVKAKGRAQALAR